MIHAEQGNTIGKRTEAIRKVSALASRPLFRGEVSEVIPGTLDRVQELQEEGYGIVVVINHFSKSDPFQLMEHVIYPHPTMGIKPLTLPIGVQNHNKLFGPWAKANNVDLLLIANNSTPQEFLDENNMQRGDGYTEYRDRATKNLLEGGTAIMVPQGSRQLQLGEYDPLKKPMWTFLRKVAQTGSEKIAVMFVGIGFTNDETEYSPSKRGFNFGDRYTHRIGNVITLEEMLQEFEGEDVDDKLYNGVDKLTHENLLLVVPQKYK